MNTFNQRQGKHRETCLIRWAVIDVPVIGFDETHEWFKDDGEPVVFSGQVEHRRLCIPSFVKSNGCFSVNDFVSSESIYILNFNVFRYLENTLFHFIFRFRRHVHAVCPDEVVVEIKEENVIDLVANCLASQFPCCVCQMIYRGFQPVREHGVTNPRYGKQEHEADQTDDDRQFDKSKTFVSLFPSY